MNLEPILAAHRTRLRSGKRGGASARREARNPYVRGVKLRNGTRLTLRPIRPKDQSLMEDLLRACSPSTLYQRFQQVVTHVEEAAARYCLIYGGPETVFVAELETDGAPRLIGFSTLALHPTPRTAEYAVLVADRWQGHGLGGLLTDHALDVAEHQGLCRVVATTTPDNLPMIRVFRKRGFLVVYDLERHIVQVEKRLDRREERRRVDIETAAQSDPNAK